MKLNEMQDKVHEGYYTLTQPQIEFGLQFIITGGECGYHTYCGTLSQCVLCPIRGYKKHVSKTVRPILIKKRLLQVMTEEKLEQLLFDKLL